METGAAGDAFRIFEGCIPGGDLGINRRPYHKNCKCALHGSRAQCARHSKYNNVSYPIRRSWSDGCLALMGHAPPPCSPSMSPGVAEIPRSNSRLVLCREEDEEEQENESPKSVSSPKLKI